MKIKEKLKDIQILGLSLRAQNKNPVKYEGDCDTSCIWFTWIGLQKSDKDTGRTEDQRKIRNHSDQSIAKIS